MLNKNNTLNVFSNVPISIIRSILLLINKTKSLLPLNLSRINKNYLVALDWRIKFKKMLNMSVIGNLKTFYWLKDATTMYQLGFKGLATNSMKKGLFVRIRVLDI